MSQGCLRTVAYSLMLVGALIGLLGLVFVLAPGRAAKGLMMLLVAGGLIGFALSRLRAMARLTPEYLAEQVSALAAASNGEVTLASACGHLRLQPEAVAPVLSDLVSRGVARVEYRDGTEYYVFPGLKETKVVKRCPYCGNEYPVNTPGRKCPSCGGNLEVTPD
ncbi:MAG: hypothetical protein HPY69_07240 [Armatimonadetes bacterium]|nr:hypothetical protein [Armatimonadota bacterium]